MVSTRHENSRLSKRRQAAAPHRQWARAGSIRLVSSHAGAKSLHYQGNTLEAAVTEGACCVRNTRHRGPRHPGDTNAPIAKVSSVISNENPSAAPADTVGAHTLAGRGSIRLVSFPVGARSHCVTRGTTEGT
jgi:hypothetical protein